jgi:hypothetical protein
VNFSVPDPTSAQVCSNPQVSQRCSVADHPYEIRISFSSALTTYSGSHFPEQETTVVELMVPAEAHTGTVVHPSAASADSSASEPSGKRLPEALNTQVEAATLH